MSEDSGEDIEVIEPVLTKDRYYHWLAAMDMTVGGKKIDGLRLLYEEMRKEKKDETQEV